MQLQTFRQMLSLAVAAWAAVAAWVPSVEPGNDAEPLGDDSGVFVPVAGRRRRTFLRKSGRPLDRYLRPPGAPFGRLLMLLGRPTVFYGALLHSPSSKRHPESKF